MRNGFSKVLSPLEGGPFLQFVKYAFCGGLATAVNVAVLFLGSWFLFPCLKKTDPFVRFFALFDVAIPTPVLTDAIRSQRTMLCSIPAFLLSNVFCYVLNTLFVFQSGRHNRTTEFLLFLLASGIAAGLGALLSGALVQWAKIDFTYATAANVITAVLINYAARKKIVFKG